MESHSSLLDVVYLEIDRCKKFWWVWEAYCRSEDAFSEDFIPTVTASRMFSFSNLMELIDYCSFKSQFVYAYVYYLCTSCLFFYNKIITNQKKKKFNKQKYMDLDGKARGNLVELHYENIRNLREAIQKNLTKVQSITKTILNLSKGFLPIMRDPFSENCSCRLKTDSSTQISVWLKIIKKDQTSRTNRKNKAVSNNTNCQLRGRLVHHDVPSI